MQIDKLHDRVPTDIAAVLNRESELWIVYFNKQV